MSPRIPKSKSLFSVTMACFVDLNTALTFLGGAKGLNAPSDYRDFNGILLPMKRRVYPVDVRRHKVAEPVLVAIDLFEITIQ
jgi:hypothetical protein